MCRLSAILTLAAMLSSCGGGGDPAAPVQDADTPDIGTQSVAGSPSDLTVGLKVLSFTQNQGDPTAQGEFKFEVTLTNTGGGDLYYVSRYDEPFIDMPSSNVLNIRFDLTKYPLSGTIAIFEPPHLRKLGPGAVRVVTFTVANPTYLSNHWGTFVDPTAPYKAIAQPQVTMTFPLSAQVHVGCAGTTFTSQGTGSEYEEFLVWQTVISSTSKTINSPP